MVAPVAMLPTEVLVVTSEVFEQTTSGTLWALCKTASGLVPGRRVDGPAKEVAAIAVAEAAVVEPVEAVEVLGGDVKLRLPSASTVLLAASLLLALIRLAAVV